MNRAHLTWMAIAAAGAGCFRSSRPAEPPGPPPGIVAGPPEPGRYLDYPKTPTITASRLPAVADDGEHVVILVDASVGAVPTPNLRLDVLNRADAVEQTLPVLAPADPEADAGLAVQTVDELLARMHQESPLRPLTLVESQGAAREEGAESSVSGQGAEVRYREGHVTVVVDSKKVVDREVPAFVAPEEKHAPSGVDCGHPSYASGAYFDVPHKLVVVRISYVGNDSCWEPAPAYHVVAW